MSHGEQLELVQRGSFESVIEIPGDEHVTTRRPDQERDLVSVPMSPKSIDLSSSSEQVNDLIL